MRHFHLIVEYKRRKIAKISRAIIMELDAHSTIKSKILGKCNLPKSFQCKKNTINKWSFIEDKNNLDIFKWAGNFLRENTTKDDILTGYIWGTEWNLVTLWGGHLYDH